MHSFCNLVICVKNYVFFIDYESIERLFIIPQQSHIQLYMSGLIAHQPEEVQNQNEMWCHHSLINLKSSIGFGSLWVTEWLSLLAFWGQQTSGSM